MIFSKKILKNFFAWKATDYFKQINSFKFQTVAGFVQLHGATAAARKFNIPPAVAAYYHRREFKNSVHNKVGRPAGRFSIGPALSSSKTHDPSSGEVRERTASLTAMPTCESKNEEESSKNGNQSLAQLWQNATGSQNSSVNAYLRGRGRGRPKLIGDELDAELVEYIVKMKQKSPTAHLTASHVKNVLKIIFNKYFIGINDCS